MSVSSAIRWVRAWRDRGEVRARPQGGDRRSGRIEAQAGFLLGQVERRPDVTLGELQALLFERGVAVGIGTLWRFFERRGCAACPRTALHSSSFIPPKSSKKPRLMG